MKECEKIVKMPLNLILLSDERCFGRSYSKQDYYWPKNKVDPKLDISFIQKCIQEDETVK